MTRPPQIPQQLAETIQTMTARWEALKASGALAGHETLIEGLEEGRTIAQIKGLSRDDLDVLYEYGFNMITAGHLDKARLVFGQLCLIDPLEPRNHYCMGVTLQLQGDPAAALEAFKGFLGLEPVNPIAYLRLGECMAAMGDHGTAREFYGYARTEADKGNGAPEIREEVYERLAQLTESAAL